MQRFTRVDSLASLCLVLALGACAPEASSPLPSHPVVLPSETPLPSTAPEPLQLKREAQGPYIEGAVEHFQLVLPEAGVDSILWSASAGQLTSQQEHATWTLPASGPATLTVTVVTKSGQQLSQASSFLVAQATRAQPENLSSVVSLATPMQVDASSDDTGYTCDLAFDATGKGHLVYINSTHPSLWYATWTGSTWTTELVDGMGFNTGGKVYYPISFVLDSANNPHIAYILEDRGVWYATRSGTTWIRERVDSASTFPLLDGYRSVVSIALDPSQGNRPTITYAYYGLLPAEGGIYDYRTVVAYRTGAGAWTVGPVKFPTASFTDSQFMAGDILFNPSGTLFVPFASGYLAHMGAWKAGSPAQSFTMGQQDLFNTNGFDPEASLSWAGTNRMLVRAPRGILDVTLNAIVANSTYTLSSIESSVTPQGDMLFTGGKPYVIHAHGYNLELVTPDARGFWTYAQLGSMSNFRRMGMALRPTTGQIHLCYALNGHVTFQ